MPFLELTLELQGLAPETAEAATFELRRAVRHPDRQSR